MHELVIECCHPRPSSRSNSHRHKPVPSTGQSRTSARDPISAHSRGATGTGAKAGAASSNPFVLSSTSRKALSDTSGKQAEQAHHVGYSLCMLLSGHYASIRTTSKADARANNRTSSSIRAFMCAPADGLAFSHTWLPGRTCGHLDLGYGLYVVGGSLLSVAAQLTTSMSPPASTSLMFTSQSSSKCIL
jgi:hypothetical protein